jgi:hypothetical protein
MTIAACYLSSEGVVFGADSTTTMFVAAPGSSPGGREHHFNHAQKVFEIGTDSTLAITIWGLGNLAETSYRTLIAQFADSLTSEGAESMANVAQRWNECFWSAYKEALPDVLERVQDLVSQVSRSPEEESQLAYLIGMFQGGFCIGGYLLNDRTPKAYEILYDPTMSAPTPATALTIGTPRFWGCPNLIERLLFGVDSAVYEAILRSEKWNGTPEELVDLISPHFLGQPHHLPIREAIDWVHASIYTTIKMMKFSHMPPACGGPVEVAVITTDRLFRWVRHKHFDAAIAEGGLYDV